MSAEPARHVGIDLGASGGRVALGEIRDGRLVLEILHRFPNGAVPLGRNLYWDVLALWREIGVGLARAGARGGVRSVGVTSWGLDYALLDADGLVIDFVHSYRDRRTEGAAARLAEAMAPAALYEATGVQFLDINTLPQLLCHRRQAAGVLDRADRLVLVADLFHYWLSGRAVAERTNASTSQLYDPRARSWSEAVCAAFAIPFRLLAPLVDPGSVLGPLDPVLAREWALEGAVVVAPASHDTASAVAAVPAEGDGWAYSSSGTWALVGVETAAPVITAAARAANLTNEQGLGGTTRLLKNMMGLWILQECRRAWEDGDYATLYAAAEAAATEARIDPDDARFLAPGLDMPARVQAYCRERGGPVPEGRGEITRCILESLAAKTGAILAAIAGVTGRAVSRLHVVGGGAQIDLLNRLTARACGIPLIAGPVEATLIGNLLVQAEALGTIAPGSLRACVRRSAAPVRYEP
ncbi:MAG: rhamnulokinase [Acetobacteraceae bacterium]